MNRCLARALATLGMLSALGSARSSALHRHRVHHSNVDLEVKRPLTPLALRNLVSFARLAGYVRFFYPGDSVLDDPLGAIRTAIHRGT
jgi:hypothetical protein